LKRALEALRDAPGLVFDLRGNEGGGEPPARYAASRFLTGKTLEGYYDYRDGQFNGKEAVWIKPGRKWKHNRPVALLTNHRNLSTSQSFVATMKQLSHVTVIGDTTAGVTGVPRTDELPCGARFIYSTGTYYLPDGTIPEWTGISPDIVVHQTVEDPKEGRDTVLEYAIKHMEKRMSP
jgi:C-terminal processing protease CtpA/Prc